MRENGILDHDVTQIHVHVDAVCLAEHRLGFEKFPIWAIILIVFGIVITMVLFYVLIKAFRNRGANNDVAQPILRRTGHEVDL